MVLMYSFKREVVHEGEARLMDPLRGSETSSLGSQKIHDISLKGGNLTCKLSEPTHKM